MESRDPFALPPPEKLREIAAKQEERAKEIRERHKRERQRQSQGATTDATEADAASIIQRNFRGHRDRRALQGYGLDPSTRWLEVCSKIEDVQDCFC